MVWIFHLIAGKTTPLLLLGISDYTGIRWLGKNFGGLMYRFAFDLGTNSLGWPSAKEGKVALTPARLAMLLEGIDWRAPQRTWRPLAAG
jgi:hypothetical protein